MKSTDELRDAALELLKEIGIAIESNPAPELVHAGSALNSSAKWLDQISENKVIATPVDPEPSVIPGGAAVDPASIPPQPPVGDPAPRPDPLPGDPVTGEGSTATPSTDAPAQSDASANTDQQNAESNQE